MADNIGGVAIAGAASAAAGTGATDAGITNAPSGGAAPTQNAIDNATPTANQPAGAPKTFDVKVDGKIVRMTEAELLSAASLGKAAFKRMEEATDMRRQNEAFIERFRKDPLGALEDPALGLSEAQRREAIEKYYQKKYIEQDKLTPEQKKLQEVEAELKKYRDKDETDKKKIETERNEALKGQYREHYTKIFTDALEKGGLPKTAKTIGRMAFYAAQARANKFDAPIEMIVDQVRQDYHQEWQEMTQAAPAEVLVQMLGPDASKKIQRYALEQHRRKLSDNSSPKQDEPVRREPRKPREEREGWNKVSRYWTRDSK